MSDASLPSEQPCVPDQSATPEQSGPEQSGPGQSRPGLGGAGVLDEVRAALDDDLSTPRALAAIDAAVSDAGNEGARSQVLEAAALLGVQL